ncbi:MAG TPA: condensation domain-containing protein, partial [Thermoanaerobaculia bacterium]|nr:condensation domain-containing protein [Thermoanaerobaculia bacterium]
AAEGVERAPLSFTQERLWFLDRLTPGLAVYNVPMVLVAEGDLDADRLAAALTALVERQSALRLRFAEGEDGRPWQHVAAVAPVELPLFDLSKMPQARREEEALTLARAEARRPFDLDGGPLARFALVRLATDRHQLHVTLHHAVADGWSLDVISRELAAIHSNLAAGRAADAGLEALPVSYVDHAVWQRELLSGERLARRLDRWRERLTGAPALLELPTDRPRPPVVDHRGGRFGFRFDAARAEAVERLAGDLGVTPFMLLLAAFDVLLSRLSGQSDVVVGTPIAARERVETEGLVGFFANTLALRTDLGGDPTFAALVGRVRDGVLGDFASQDLPFEELVSAVAPQRNMSHTPIFQVLMSYRSGGAGGALEAGGVLWQRRGVATGTSKYDLSLDLLRHDEGIDATVDWYADVFDESTVRRWMGHLERLLDAALEEPETPISELPLLADDERRRLLAGWNDTAREYGGPEALGDLVARQAAATPDAPALSFGDQRLTYAELSARVRALAAELRRRGVMAETAGDRLNNLSPVSLVGVAMERSVELVVALHAVVAAGGAYVPIDPGYPEERVAFMIGDALAGGGVLLTQEVLRERMEALAPEGVEVLAVDGLELPETAELPPSGAGPESAVYAIYTS